MDALAKERSETKDVAAAHPEKAKEMVASGQAGKPAPPKRSKEEKQKRREERKKKGLFGWLLG